MKIYITMASTDEIIAVYKKEYNGRYTCLTGFVQDNGEWTTLLEEKALPAATVAKQVARLKASEDFGVHYGYKF